MTNLAGNGPSANLLAVCVLLVAGENALSAGIDDDRGPAAARTVDFDRDIRPLLADRCFACHGPDENTREADLRLDLHDAAFADRGGYHAVAAGDREASELWQRVSSRDPDLRMPPREAARQLSDAEVALLGRWIDQGAPWSQHWAFTPPVRPPLPPLPPLPQGDARSRNAIDRFIRSRLRKEGIEPTREADRATLVRRVALALTGLPATASEVDAFVADDAPDAYERLVERLLMSPRYGEHMARPWLDAARYADTDGYQNDRLRYMSVWRDWVLLALNANLPFDQFTVEQLAGDMLPNATLYQQVATGFCRNHRINSEGGSIPEEWAIEYVVDRVDTVGTVWLGLTLGCARCHDHKYDPVSQRDYYRLFAYFNNVPEWGLGPNNGNSPPFIQPPATWPHLSPDENRSIEPAPYTLKTTQTSVVRPNPGGAETVMVMQELPEPRPTYLLRRGRYDAPDKSNPLAPGIPDSLATPDADPPTDRLELARWLVDPANPLTARVTVNRHWQHFFGTGLVKTSENFGTQGELPSHPELLDWLATELVRTGWDIKALHRQIVTSATYRQSSAQTDRGPETVSAVEIDPENRLLWRGPRFRLSAHEIRDQALAVSGLLVERLGGPSVKPYMPPGIWRSISNNKYVQDHGENLYRRSLYTYWRRTVPPPSMMAFNAAEREVCIVRKDRTTTPLQALTLMNNVTFVEAARMLAEDLLRAPDSSLDDRLSAGYLRVTARPPASGELDRLREAHSRFLATFTEHPAAAEQLLAVGEAPRDNRREPAEHAAMTMVANLLLNLDQAVTLE